MLTSFCWLDIIKLQYALNMEQYDIAQQLRNKLSEVRSHFRNCYISLGQVHEFIHLTDRNSSIIEIQQRIFGDILEL